VREDCPFHGSFKRFFPSESVAKTGTITLRRLVQELKIQFWLSDDDLGSRMHSARTRAGFEVRSHSAVWKRNNERQDGKDKPIKQPLPYRSVYMTNGGSWMVSRVTYHQTLKPEVTIIYATMSSDWRVRCIALTLLH
jgi:hypothetical protein